MQIAKSKNVEDVDLIEEKFIKMGKELSYLRPRESIMKYQLQEERKILRKRLHEKETQFVAMASLSIKALQCRKPSKSYALFLKKQWL